MIRLSNRVHMFANTAHRPAFLAFFTEVLGCELPTSIAIPQLDQPVLVFEFANGGSLSVEFSAEMPRVERGAWLELVVDDADDVKRKIIEAGLPRVDYLGTEAFYFEAPGGQVMRIVSDS